MINKKHLSTHWYKPLKPIRSHYIVRRKL